MIPGFRGYKLRGRGAFINTLVGGHGPPVLLLHGYLQTHVAWRAVAVDLAKDFTVVATDLRGYGDSDKPDSVGGHVTYSKRMMADDQVAVMEILGFPRFFVTGHDRGGRVAHRMALDHPDRVTKLAVLDIAPTLAMYERTDRRFATSYYHWFFLIQPYDFPERMIASNPEDYLRWNLDATVSSPDALAEYLRCFRDQRAIHASCEDYRASASIDLDHDRSDLDHKVICPMLVLWGEQSTVGTRFDVLKLWQERATHVTGDSLPCGHFLPEARPADVAGRLRRFFRHSL